MADGNLTEVAVWSADGLVLFSNRAEDIGHKVSPPPDGVPQAIAGQTTSDFEDGEPEADSACDPADDAAGRPERFVEVYTPLHVTGSRRWSSRRTTTTSGSTRWRTGCCSTPCHLS